MMQGRIGQHYAQIRIPRCDMPGKVRCGCLGLSAAAQMVQREKSEVPAQSREFVVLPDQFQCGIKQSEGFPRDAYAAAAAVSLPVGGIHHEVKATQPLDRDNAFAWRNG